MKSYLSYFVILFFLSTYTYAQQPGNTLKPVFKIVTIVESISYNGNGESRIIDSQTEVDDSEYATYRTDESKDKNRELKGKKVKIDNLEETKLLNIYDGSDVAYKNVASNDAMITSKINSMVKEGWTLVYVNSVVESDAGEGDRNGIFITRLFFSR